MEKKLDKKEVRTPDQISQSLDRFMDFIAKNVALLGVLLGLFILAGLALSGWDYMRSNKEEKLQAEFSSIEKDYLDQKSKFKEAEIEATKKEDVKKTAAKDAKKPQEEKALAKATGDLSKDYGTIPERFENLIKGEEGTKAAQMAAIHLAEIYSTHNQKDKALEALEKVSKGNSTNEVLGALVVNFKAALMADKGECPQAVEMWQKVLGQRKVAYMHDEAKLRMALCYEKMNDTAKAEQFYTELTKVENDGENMDRAVSEDAKKYLRLLKVRANGGT